MGSLSWRSTFTLTTIKFIYCLLLSYETIEHKYNVVTLICVLFLFSSPLDAETEKVIDDILKKSKSVIALGKKFLSEQKEMNVIQALK